MNCHNAILANDPRLALVRESFATGKPIPWIQIHKTPDFVYFNHSVHVNRGISCVECHGQINKMDEVYHAKPLSMSFCLECHRDPASKLRPPDKITDLNWKWSDDPKTGGLRWHDEMALADKPIQDQIDSLRDAAKLMESAGFKDKK